MKNGTPRKAVTTDNGSPPGTRFRASTSDTSRSAAPSKNEAGRSCECPGPIARRTRGGKKK